MTSSVLSPVQVMQRQSILPATESTFSWNAFDTRHESNKSTPRPPSRTSVAMTSSSKPSKARDEDGDSDIEITCVKKSNLAGVHSVSARSVPQVKEARPQLDDQTADKLMARARIRLIDSESEVLIRAQKRKAPADLEKLTVMDEVRKNIKHIKLDEETRKKEARRQAKQPEQVRPASLSKVVSPPPGLRQAGKPKVGDTTVRPSTDKVTLTPQRNDNVVPDIQASAMVESFLRPAPIQAKLPTAPSYPKPPTTQSRPEPPNTYSYLKQTQAALVDSRPAPINTTGLRKMPFMIDEDSSDDETKAPRPKPAARSTSKPASNVARPLPSSAGGSSAAKLSEAQREAAHRESARLRQEKWEKKHGAVSSPASEVALQPPTDTMGNVIDKLLPVSETVNKAVERSFGANTFSRQPQSQRPPSQPEILHPSVTSTALPGSHSHTIQRSDRTLAEPGKKSPNLVSAFTPDPKSSPLVAPDKAGIENIRGANAADARPTNSNDKAKAEAQTASHTLSLSSTEREPHEHSNKAHTNAIQPQKPIIAPNHAPTDFNKLIQRPPASVIPAPTSDFRPLAKDEVVRIKDPKMLEASLRHEEKRKHQMHFTNKETGSAVDRARKDVEVIKASTANLRDTVKEAPDQRELAAKKEAAANARKAADEKREIEARHKAQAKRAEEERKYVEDKKAREAHRATMLKRQETMNRERDTVAQRESSMAKLMAAAQNGKRVGVPEQQRVNAAPATTIGTKPANNPEQMFSPVAAVPNKSAGVANFPTTMLASQGTKKNYLEPTDAKAPAPREQVQPDTPTFGSSDITEAVESAVAKTQRIAEMRKRNAKMRQADESEEQDVVVDKIETLPFTPLQPKPMSLNSVAGQKAVADVKVGKHYHADKHQNNPKYAVHPGETDGYLRKYKRHLGAILPQDIKLVRWKETPLDWPQVTTLYSKAFGSKSLDTIRRRYYQVKDALQSSPIDAELLSRVAENVLDARAELNRLVHGTWPLPGSTGNWERSRDAKGHFVAGGKPPARASIEYPLPPFPANSSFESKTLTGSTVPSPERDELSDSGKATQRPQIGGKTIDIKTVNHFMDMRLDMCHEEYEAIFRPASPMRDEDRCHYVYRVLRRELSKQDVEEDADIEEEWWTFCGPAYDSLADANFAAEFEAYRVHRQDPNSMDAYKGHTQSTGYSKEDFVWHERRWEDGGIVQVKVSRDMCTFDQGRLPESKEGWLAKTAYSVKECTTTKSGDGMFESQKQSIIERYVDRTAYTALGMANECAVKRMVALTFVPESANLNRRAAEIQAREQELLLKLELQGDEAMFDQEAESQENGTMTVMRVWVEEGPVKGPRNVY